MNMQQLMAQAQKMQRDMEKKQQEVRNSEYTGSSQLVDVVISGDRRIKSVKIKATGTMDEEDLEMLEDMIKIAVNDANENLEKDLESKMGPMAKQLGGLM